MTDREAVEQLRQRAWTGQTPGLERIRRLLDRLGRPQDGLRFVHIAGSNGKGSTAALLASALTQAGLRTGLYTSPHLQRFHERFQIDGGPIPPNTLAETVRTVLDAAEDQTEFELMTAVGMLYFRAANCDFVVLETGLGGRLDSTNVIESPAACLITRIGLEHTQLLGDTLGKIAGEKAGIIKPGSPVVVCKQEQAVLDAISARCDGNALTVTAPDRLRRLSCSPEGQRFTYRDRGPYQISLLGGHQLENAAAALDTLWALGLPEEAITRGLENARWPGRLELVRRGPDVLLDGGHNPQCMQAVVQALDELYPGKKVLFLLGVMADKDFISMLQILLPYAKQVVCTAPDSPRALPPEELSACVQRLGGTAQACPTVREAVETVLALAGPEDVVCMCGSLYLIGELKELL